MLTIVRRLIVLLLTSPLAAAALIGFYWLHHHDTGVSCPWWLGFLVGVSIGHAWTKAAAFLADIYSRLTQ